MDVSVRRGITAGVAIAAAAALGTAGSASAAQQAYAPGKQAQSLNGGPGGWTATDTNEGLLGSTLCIVSGVLICPESDSSHSTDGGASGTAGDGYLNAEFSVIAGVAGKGTSVWESKEFTYKGVKDKKAKRLTFKAKQQSDLTELLALPSSSASYTAEIIPGDGGPAIGAGDGDIPATQDWTALEATDIPANELKRGDAYSIRITSVYETGLVGVVADGTVGYDNVKLVANTRKGGGGGGGTATNRFKRQARNGLGPAVERGKFLFLKVRCPKAAAPDNCKIKVRALMKKKGPRATNAKRVNAAPGQKGFVKLKVRPAMRSKVANKKTIFAKAKYKAGAQKVTITKRVKVKH